MNKVPTGLLSIRIGGQGGAILHRWLKKPSPTARAGLQCWFMKAPKLSMHAMRSFARAAVRPVALLGRHLGSPLRERIILRVSSINSCSVCSVVHGAVARFEGLSADDVNEARTASDQLDDRTKVALRYAELRTSDLEQDFPDDVAVFERDFSVDEQREVRAVVDLFTFNNRFNNTWEAVLPGAAWRREKLGIR